MPRTPPTSRFRPPRWVYWIIGAAIAFVGAYVARGMSENLPVTERVPYWLGGSVFVFLGLYVLSLGTRFRRKSADRHRSDPE